MHTLLGIASGVVVGAMVFDERGVLLGAVLGWVVVKLLDLSRRLDRLEAQGRVPEPGPASRAREVASATTMPAAAASEPGPAATQPEPAPPPQPGSSAASNWGRPSAAVAAEESEWVRRLRALVFGGNTAVRVGVVVLFFGVAFLLKYAVEHGLLPIELRLAGAALGGIALLGIGWRLRERRADYALTLQGGGIGILYLTVFAALRLYQLIPASAAFALLVAIVVFSALLALRQSSLALAVLGVTGGFLAPVLTSAGAGNHVLLFGYYALLNAGIMLVGWFRVWRVLNLVGFAFTFVIGASWGYRYYRPEFFASTEPFLVLFFLMYAAIAVLSALRQPPDLRGYVDGTLVFGVPIVGALLQAALVRDTEYGLAWSALALGFFYLTLAGALFRRSPQTLRLLVEAFLALGAIFATLAIPLAFEGRWTAAAWAVEGAGILWVGVRQRRRSARWFGVALIFAAGFFFLSDRHAAGGLAVLNAHYLGTLLIAVAALFAGRMLHGAREAIHEGPIALALLVWGLLWWYGGGLREIERHVAWPWAVAVTGTVIALSSLAAELLGRPLRWPALRTSSGLLLPALILFLAYGWLATSHPFADAGYAVWLTGLAVFYWVAYRQEPDGAMFAVPAQHALAFLLWTTVMTVEAAWVMRELVPEGRDWRRLAWLVAPAVMLALAAASPTRWPLTTQRISYLGYAAVPIVLGVLLIVFYTSAKSPGDPAPLDYLPLANPLELATLFAALAVARWLLVVRTFDPAWLRDTWKMLAGLAAAVAFVWLNAVLFRSLHHYAGIEYRFEPMFRSVLAQASLSIFWSVLALVLVTVATRLRQRLVWIGGAALLGAVVAKLFLIDLAGTGTVARIVSFIGVGVLLLIIGYLAPVPPRTTVEGKA